MPTRKSAAPVRKTIDSGIRIPDFLERLLKKNDSLYGPVLTSLRDFNIWLKERKLFFFPEYTDHGPTHVESVLRGFEWLLPDETRKVLEPEDAAVLVLAAVLHDCAMHLTREGFLKLTRSGSNWPPKTAQFLTAMKDPPWPDLWEGFLREASRWDDQKRVALFGQAISTGRPPENADWSEHDRLFVGEFLRRHHARLAHEIAVCGVPGPTEDSLEFSAVEPWMRDLAGLVARSHGLDLRAVVDRLPANDRAEIRRVHAPLLMVLLRIADYLEIDNSRSPVLLRKLRTLQSPVSRQEEEKHHAVVDVKFAEKDPEAVWIVAEPKSLATFVGLQDLFAGIQRELDASWAVLGEIYKSDRRFGIRIRRVRSNLDDVAAFAETADFVPVRAAFGSAGGDLLKLMVGPLYGHHPAYGIRELIQNAVDACRELEDILAHGHAPVDRPQLEADVVVSVLEEDPDGRGRITVEDRGIGMTPEVITNYFLKAGASLRKSEAWHRLHDDPNGQTRVSRAGRFGLGVLATFLLGDEVEVTTRHADEPRGVKFVARLDNPCIELSWVPRPVGTTIEVRITRPEVLDALANVATWDWYRLQQPSVLRRVRLQRNREGRLRSAPLGRLLTPEHGEIIPHGARPLPAPWRRLERSDFREVLWALERTTGHEDVSNGIVLQLPDAMRVGWPVLWPEANGASDFVLFRPRLAVIDGASLLEVDLRRTEIAGSVPFQEDLTTALCRDILASLLVRAAGSREAVLGQIARGRDPRDFLSLASLWHPAISTQRDEYATKMPGLDLLTFSWLFATPQGLTLEDPALLGDEPRYGVAFIGRPEGDPNIDAGPVLARALDRVPPGFPIGIDSSPRITRGFWHSLEKHRQSGHYACCAVLLPTRTWGAVKQEDRPRVLSESDAGNGWTVLWIGDAPVHRLDLARLGSKPPEEDDVPLALFLLPEGEPPRAPRNPLSQLWHELTDDADIAYDPALRKQVLRRAFRELHDEIDLWQRMATAAPGDREAAARYWFTQSH